MTGQGLICSKATNHGSINHHARAGVKVVPMHPQRQKYKKYNPTILIMNEMNVPEYHVHHILYSRSFILDLRSIKAQRSLV